tara:strand:- start:3649 stop:4752 length:1104 start_codon:yes stop_codon:yes gene_type:complete
LKNNLLLYIKPKGSAKFLQLSTAFFCVLILLFKLLLLWQPERIFNFSTFCFCTIGLQLQHLTGLFSFSIGDLFYISILLIFLFGIFKLFHPKNSTNQKIITLWASLLMVTSLYAVFFVNWSLNYQKNSLAQQEDTQVINESDLIHYTLGLLSILNELDSTTLNQQPLTTKEIYNEARASYLHYDPHIEELLPSIPKSSSISTLLSYMGYGGYYNPFTHEAQVNAKLPHFRLGTVATHEIAHQLGIAPEDQANFIGIYIAMKSENKSLRYDANLSALLYCLNDIYQLDRELYQDLSECIPEYATNQWKEMNQFWNTYKNPLEPLFKKGFDLFLKSNRQKQGIKSYQQVTKHLIRAEKYDWAPKFGLCN